MSRSEHGCSAVNRGGKGNKIKVKSTTNGVREVIEVEVCDDCITWYQRNNLIVRTEHDKKDWIERGR